MMFLGLLLSIKNQDLQLTPRLSSGLVGVLREAGLLHGDERCKKWSTSPFGMHFYLLKE